MARRRAQKAVDRITQKASLTEVSDEEDEPPVTKKSAFQMMASSSSSEEEDEPPEVDSPGNTYEKDDTVKVAALCSTTAESIAEGNAVPEPSIAEGSDDESPVEGDRTISPQTAKSKKKQKKKKKKKGGGGGSGGGGGEGVPTNGGISGTDRPFVGTDIEIQGLKAKPELNGRRGRCIDFVVSSGRYTVNLRASAPAPQGTAAPAAAPAAAPVAGGNPPSSSSSSPEVVALRPENMRDASKVDRGKAAAEEAEAGGGGLVIRLRFRRIPFGVDNHVVRCSVGRDVRSVKDLLNKRIYSDTGVDEGQLPPDEMEILFKGRVLTDSDTLASVGVDSNNAKLGFRRKANTAQGTPGNMSTATAAAAGGVAAAGGTGVGGGGGGGGGDQPELERQAAEEAAAKAAKAAEADAAAALLLPYGGDVNLAMRANDRDAIRAIFEFRKRVEVGSSGGSDNSGSGNSDSNNSNGSSSGTTSVSGGGGGSKDSTNTTANPSSDTADSLVELASKLTAAAARVSALEATASTNERNTAADYANVHPRDGSGGGGGGGSQGSSSSSSSQKSLLQTQEAVTQEMLALDNLHFPSLVAGPKAEAATGAAESDEAKAEAEASARENEKEGEGGLGTLHALQHRLRMVRKELYARLDRIAAAAAAAAANSD